MNSEEYVEYISQEDITYIRDNFESLMTVALVVAEEDAEDDAIAG